MVTLIPPRFTCLLVGRWATSANAEDTAEVGLTPRASSREFPLAEEFVPVARLPISDTIYTRLSYKFDKFVLAGTLVVKEHVRRTREQPGA